MKTKTLLLPNQSLYGKSWRDHLLIHPAAELFPRMSPAELRALGEDIKQNGLTSPIVLWSDRKSPGVLLDGRNRLDAIEMATGPVTVGAPSIMAGKEFLALDKVIVLDKSVDPYGFVISANIHRRHLSIEDKDRLIVKVLQADPTKSNRQVAEMVKASHPHVAKVRKQAEKAGDVETVTTSIDTKGRKQPSRRNRIPSLHRAAKLGEETVAKIKGTSLNNAREMDELVVLNRGAAKGELTPIVKRLVEDAAAGKDVSTIAEVAKIKGRTEPALQVSEKVLVQRAAAAERIRALMGGKTHDHIGAASNGETERLRARCEELENEKNRLEWENIALKTEVAELKAHLSKLAPLAPNDPGPFPACLRRRA